MSDHRLIRECPTPYEGGTCGCGSDCTSPADAVFEDKLHALQAERGEAYRRAQEAERAITALLQTRMRNAHASR